MRWSLLRAGLGIRKFNVTGQVGDGRESAAADYVVAHARPGDIDDALAAVDRYSYDKSFLVNVGDEKGKLLDAAVRLFAGQGVAGTTVAEIAQRAGVTSAMVHYYFKTKDQLLDAVVEEKLIGQFMARSSLS